MVTTSLKETTPSSIQSPVSSTLRNTPTSPKRDPKRSHWFLRRLACEWSSFVTRLKDLSEPRSPSEETLDSIFDSSDDDYFGRSQGKYSHVSPIESEFLLDYKKYRTLEKVYEAHKLATLHLPVYSRTEKSSHSSHSSHPINQANGGSEGQIQNEGQLLGQNQNLSRSYSNSPTKIRLPLGQRSIMSTKLNPATKDTSAVITLDEEIKRTGSTTNGAVSDLNSGTLESHELPNSAEEIIEAPDPDAATSNPVNGVNSTLNNLFPLPQRRRSTCNLGENLWEERRSRWLETTLSGPEEIKNRQAALSLSHVNAKLHPQIYTMFVEKSKPLKSGTRINLEDLVGVINAGWTKEAKWERAARGLP